MPSIDERIPKPVLIDPNRADWSDTGNHSRDQVHCLTRIGHAPDEQAGAAWHMLDRVEKIGRICQLKIRYQGGRNGDKTPQSCPEFHANQVITCEMIFEFNPALTRFVAALPELE